MSLRESLVGEEEEPPDGDGVAVTERDETPEEDRSRTKHLVEGRGSTRTEASARAPRQFESHCILRLCNAVDDENAVTAVEVVRSAVRRTGGQTTR